MELIGTIRRFRKSHGIRDSLPLTARVAPRADQRDVLAALRPEIERLANISTLEVLNEPGDPAGCARLVADGAQVHISLAGVLDPEAERARLSKRLAQIEGEAEQVNKKLSNEAFVAKAPPDVVQKERSRLAALAEETAALAGSSTSSPDDRVDRIDGLPRSAPGPRRAAAGVGAGARPGAHPGHRRIAEPPRADLSVHPGHRHEWQDHHRADDHGHRLCRWTLGRNVHLSTCGLGDGATRAVRRADLRR